MEWQMEPTILPSLLIQVKLENSILGKHEISLTHLLVENGSQGRPPGYTDCPSASEKFSNSYLLHLYM